MPQLVQDEAGSYFVDTGGGVLQPVSADQAKVFLGNQGAGEAAFQSAGQGLENLITGAGSLLSDNPYWQQQNELGRAQSEALNIAQPIAAGAAQYAPQALLGAATAGAGLLPTVGVEAALGAATTPETPVQGAILGGLTAGAAYALPGAVGAAVGKGRDLAGSLPFFGRSSPLEEIPINPGGMVPGERPPLGGAGAEIGGAPAGPGAGAATVPGAPGAGAAPQPRMADRVREAMAAAEPQQAVAGTRVMEGTLPPDALYQYGVPVSPAQRALLEAQDATQASRARDLLAQEEASMSSPTWGAKQRAIRDAQQQSATNYLTRQLDMPADINLTDPMLSDVFARLGSGFDQMAQEMGSVQLSKPIQDDMAEILAQATGSHKGQLESLVKEVQAKADLNAGALVGDQWIEMRTKINNMIEAGQRQGNIGKISDAAELMETLTRAMESGLPDASRQQLQQLRHQYSIAMSLSKAGSRNADGQVIPVSCYNNRKRSQSNKAKGTDEVGRFMNTIVTLTKKRTPDSGTAGRLLQNAASLGADMVPGGNTIRRLTGI